METCTEISAKELKRMIAEHEDIVIWDIRLPKDYKVNHIEHAINITDDNLAAEMQKIDKEQTVIVYCYRGISSKRFADYLLTQGFSHVYNLHGGFNAF